MTLKLNHFRFILQLVCTTFIILGTLFIFSNNVSAVSDYVENISGVSGNQPILSNCDITCYQQYKYAIIEYTPAVSNYSFAIKANFTIGNTTGYGKSFYLAHNSGFNLIDITGISSVFVGDGTFSYPAKITLTENLPGPAESDCPEPDPCDCDTPPIVAFFRDVFLNVVTGIIPAFAVFVVVWFMVDLLSSLWFGRGK